MSIGHKTRALLDTEELIDVYKEDIFQRCKNILCYSGNNHLSFTDPLLKDLVILFPENQTDVSCCTVVHLARRFLVLYLKKNMIIWMKNF